MSKLKPIQQIIKMIILIAILIPCGLILQVSYAATQLQVAPLNPAFIEWQKQQSKPFASRSSIDVTTEGEQRYYGFRPSLLDFSHLKQKLEKDGLTNQMRTAFLPTTYDLRTLNKLTPVKNQAPYGTCWAFAAMASIESYLMPEENRDFSEKQLAYIAYSGDMDSFTRRKVEPEQHEIFDQGGEMWKATALLARWSGPVDEKDVPYGDETPFPKKPVQKHLRQAIYLPNRTIDTFEQFNPVNIKTALITYGALCLGMNYTDSPEDYNENESAYYFSGERGANHEVNVVGWDDSFAKEKFTTMPPGNGAWIVRNSWGTNYGEDGYFYISYYDKALDDGVALVVEDTKNYENIYQYDPLGWTASIGDGVEQAVFANVFTAKDDENLEAVSFYVPTTKTKYKIFVYTDCQDLPESGTPSGSTLTGTINEPGYHTVDLEKSVALKKGQKFSVVVSVKTPGYNFPVPVERIFEEYSENARAEAGQSYVSLGKDDILEDITTFADLEQANVCLKAFTSKKKNPQTPIIMTGDIESITLSHESNVKIYGTAKTKLVSNT